MSARQPERRWRGIAAGYAIFVIVLAAATTPIYRVVEPVQRPLVARVSAALLLGVVAIHLVSIARARIDAQPPSEFELALGPVALTPKLDARFVELREELRYSVRNFRYFDHVLWPRLVALRERLPVAADRPPIAQPQGRSFGRGPSLTAIEALVTRMEEPR
jgi:hypothetical protein